jgi:transposase
MAVGHGVDLRAHALAAYAKGRGSLREIAALFGVSVSSLVRWRRRAARTGHLRPAPHGGGARRKLDERAVVLVRDLLRTHRGLYLRELQTALAERLAVRVSLAALSRLLQRERLRRKRPRSTRPSGTVRRSRRSA